MRYALLALLLTSCVTPAQPRLKTVYSGPYAWRNSGASRSDGLPVDLNARNAVWSRERHYEPENLYDYLNHELKGKP